MPNPHLARRVHEDFRRHDRRPRGRARDRRASRARRRRDPRRRRAPRPHAAYRPRRTRRDRHPRDAGRPRAAASRCRARDGRGRQRDLPGDSSHDRPRDRERLLLRLRARASRSRPRTSRRSRSGCTRSSRATSRSLVRFGPRGAVEFFRAQGEIYKAEIIAAIPAGEPITLYRQGNSSTCAAARTCLDRAGSGFKLMKLAGAYWRGDSRNEMLQRIYGTAWADDKKSSEAISPSRRSREPRSPQARPRDRPVPFPGRSGGAVFWHPKGWTLLPRSSSYMRVRQIAAGYREVNTPEIMSARCGRSPATWRSSARTCSRRRRRTSGCSRSSR